MSKRFEDISAQEIVELYGSYDLLREIGLKESVSHFEEEEILIELGYDENLCFETKEDMIEYINYENIPVKDIFESMNDQEISDRVAELIEKNKITYQEWDNFLKNYE
jgi:hypothetical protein